MQLAPSSCTRNESFWSEEHDHNKNDPKDQVADTIKGEGREYLFQGEQDVSRIRGNSIQLRQDEQVDRIDGDSTYNDARDTTQATDDHHRQIDDRVLSAKVIRRDGAQLRRVIGTGNA